MLRLLASLLVAASLFPVFAWLLAFSKAGFKYQDHEFSYPIQLAVLCFATLLMFGLPWVFYIRSRKITGFAPIVLLAGAMAVIPFTGSYIAVTAAEYVEVGQFPRLDSNFLAEAAAFVFTIFMFGAFCGAVIWVLGVYRNKFFS